MSVFFRGVQSVKNFADYLNILWCVYTLTVYDTHRKTVVLQRKIVDDVSEYCVGWGGGSLCMMGLKILKLSPNFTVAQATNTVSKTLPCVQDTLVDFNGCHGCMCYNHRLHTSLTGYCHSFIANYTVAITCDTYTHRERGGEKQLGSIVVGRVSACRGRH